MYFGAHVKSSGGVWHAIENGVDIGAEAVQFFAGSPRTWAPTVYKDKDAAQFREARAASPIRFVLIHTIYLINLASEKEDFYEKSVTSLCGALAAADQLGADAIVTHIGSHQGAGFEAGLERVQAGLRRALAESEGSPVRLLLENTAGAGGTMGVDFLELGQIIDAAGGDPRLGVCLDTAHIFESGVDLRTPEGMAEALAARRRRLRPRAPRRAAPERLQDAARLQPRPPRERRRGRPRRGRLPHDRQRAGVRRPARHPRGAGVRRPGSGRGEPGPPARARRRLSRRLTARREAPSARGYTRAAPCARRGTGLTPKASQPAVRRRYTDYCEVTRWNS